MENVFADILRELIDIASDEDLYCDGDFNAGYRMAIYNVLSIAKTDIVNYGLNVKDYLGDFDPDEWLKLGRDYLSR